MEIRHRLEPEERREVFETLAKEIRRRRAEKIPASEVRDLVTAFAKLSRQSSGPPPKPQRWSWAGIMSFVAARERAFSAGAEEDDPN